MSMRENVRVRGAPTVCTACVCTDASPRPGGWWAKSPNNFRTRLPDGPARCDAQSCGVLRHTVDNVSVTLREADPEPLFRCTRR